MLRLKISVIIPSLFGAHLKLLFQKQKPSSPFAEEKPRAKSALRRYALRGTLALTAMGIAGAIYVHSRAPRPAFEAYINPDSSTIQSLDEPITDTLSFVSAKLQVSYPDGTKDTVLIEKGKVLPMVISADSDQIITLMFTALAAGRSKDEHEVLRLDVSKVSMGADTSLHAMDFNFQPLMTLNLAPDRIMMLLTSHQPVQFVKVGLLSVDFGGVQI